MLGTTDLATYVVGAFLIILLPGPNSLYTLSVAARLGVRRGYRAALGVFLGDSILMLLTAAGAAQLLKTNDSLYSVVKYAGGAYLAVIAIGMLRAAWGMWQRRNDPQTTEAVSSPIDPDRAVAHATVDAPAAAVHGAAPAAAADAVHGAAPAAQAAAADGERPFRRALLISLLNPKAILFFISFFVQFVDPDYAHPALSFLLLAAIVQVFSAAYLTVLIFGGNRLAAQFRRRTRLSATLTTAVGTGFLAFAAKLATSSAR